LYGIPKYCVGIEQLSDVHCRMVFKVMLLVLDFWLHSQQEPLSSEARIADMLCHAPVPVHWLLSQWMATAQAIAYVPEFLALSYLLQWLHKSACTLCNSWPCFAVLLVILPNSIALLVQLLT